LYLPLTFSSVSRMLPVPHMVRPSLGQYVHPCLSPPHSLLHVHKWLPRVPWLPVSSWYPSLSLSFFFFLNNAKPFLGLNSNCVVVAYELLPVLDKCVWPWVSLRNTGRGKSPSAPHLQARSSAINSRVSPGRRAPCGYAELPRIPFPRTRCLVPGAGRVCL
jgi:hypothetical protein